MNKNTYLKLSLDPSFLKGSDSSLQKSANELHIVLYKTFAIISRLVKLAQAKHDVLKADEPESYSNLQVAFNKNDEIEIARGLTYKICKELELEECLSIKKIKEALFNLGIENQDLQDFILQLILQNRIGIHYALVRTLCSFIPQTLTRNAEHQTLISIDSQLQADTDNNRKHGSLIIKYDRFFECVKLVFKGLMTFGDIKPIIIGEAKMTLVITPQLDVRIDSLYSLFYPYKEIAAQQISRRELTKYKCVLNSLYTKLVEESLANHESRRSPTSESTSKSINEIEANENKRSDSLFGWLKQIGSISLNNNDNEIKNFQKRAKRQSMLTPRCLLVNENRSMNIYNFDPHGILNCEGNNAMYLEKFNFMPSGIIQHQHKELNKNSLRKKTNHLPNTINSTDQPDLMTSLKRTSRPFNE